MNVIMTMSALKVLTTFFKLENFNFNGLVWKSIGLASECPAALPLALT